MSQPSSSSEKRRRNYQSSFSKHGTSPRSLQWSGYRAAARRYRALTKNLDVTSKSILDAGCGMGDLLPFLYARGLDFQYKGVDITPEFIETAEKRYLGHEFAVADPFSDTFTEQYDIVLCCGVLNQRTKDWMEQRKRMLDKLLSLSKEIVVFNMAGFRGATESDNGQNVAYAPLEEIVAYCQTIGTVVEVDDSYHSKDFTVVLQK